MLCEIIDVIITVMMAYNCDAKSEIYGTEIFILRF